MRQRVKSLPTPKIGGPDNQCFQFGNRDLPFISLEGALATWQNWTSFSIY